MAAIARDTSELLELSVEATHIIFRMARELHRRSVMVDRTNGYWARTVLGISPERVQPILDGFHQSQVSRSFQKCQFSMSILLTTFSPDYSSASPSLHWFHIGWLAHNLRAPNYFTEPV